MKLPVTWRPQTAEAMPRTMLEPKRLTHHEKREKLALVLCCECINHDPEADAVQMMSRHRVDHGHDNDGQYEKTYPCTSAGGRSPKYVSGVGYSQYGGVNLECNTYET